MYYEIPWLDIPMHIMGGFGVASLVLSIASYKQKKLSYRTTIILFLIVAVGWELYEVAHDYISEREWGGFIDTFSDIINGTIGASIGYYLLKK